MQCWGIKLRAMYLLDRHSTKWDTSPAPVYLFNLSTSQCLCWLGIFSTLSYLIFVWSSWERLLWFGIANLLCGIMTVCFHLAYQMVLVLQRAAVTCDMTITHPLDAGHSLWLAVYTCPRELPVYIQKCLLNFLKKLNRFRILSCVWISPGINPFSTIG